MRRTPAHVLVFATSGLVLVLEIAAGRLMAPYIGVSIDAFTGIIGTILAGIALGASYGGRLADRQDPRPLIAHSLLIGGGLTLLSVPIVVTLGPSVTSGPVGIVILTAAAFFAPAAVLSAIAPMVAKLRVDDLDESGSIIGDLSAAGTVGALVGTFGTGFFLLSIAPVRLLIVAIGAILVLSGIAVHWRNGRRPDFVETTLAIAAAVIAIGIGSPCDLETEYHCVRIVADDDRAGGRSLLLDRFRHAHVDLDDPTHLEIRYMRLLAASIDTLPDGPVDALHLGGGGFTIPRWLNATRPGSTQTALELDAELVEIARRELGLADAGPLDIRVGDARLHLSDLATDGYDVIVGDAFGGDVVPWHLTTVEVVDELRRMLRPGGILVMNVIDRSPDGYANAQAATLAERFDWVGVIEPIDGTANGRVNQILLAGDHTIDPTIASEDGRQLADDEVAARLQDARVLTDDFAPVDQLQG